MTNPAKESQQEKDKNKEGEQKKKINKVEKFIEKRIDPYGEALMGELWRVVFETIQDTIALSILIVIPGVILKLFANADYSDFAQCLAISALNVSRIICFVIVGSGFLLWTVLGGRFIGRTISIIAANIRDNIPMAEIEEVRK